MLSIKTKILAEKKYLGSCSYCGIKGFVTLYVSQNYTCFLGISYWPLKKQSFSTCSHCKQTLVEGEMPSSMKAETLPLLKSARTPILSYGGIIFIMACFGYGLYAAYSQDVRTETLVLEPKIGDVYYTNYEIDEFRAMKVIRVTTDSVFFNPSRYISDKESGISAILKKEPAFESYSLGFSKSLLVDDAKRNKIIDIRRE